MNTFYKATGLAVLLISTIVAQRPFGGPNPGTPPDPAVIVQRRVERLTERLNLTTAQASQATTIYTTALTATAPLQSSISQARESLAAAVKSNAITTIDQLATTIGTATGQITSIQNKADAAFYAILTADQQAKFGNGFPGPGFGGPGPRPRP